MSVKKPLEKVELPKVNVDDLISKGAKVREDNKVPKNDGFEFINLRIPSKLLESLALVLDKRVGISRTGWILEAIHEKIKRDSE